MASFCKNAFFGQGRMEFGKGGILSGGPPARRRLAASCFSETLLIIKIFPIFELMMHDWGVTVVDASHAIHPMQNKMQKKATFLAGRLSELRAYA